MSSVLTNDSKETNFQNIIVIHSGEKIIVDEVFKISAAPIHPNKQAMLIAYNSKTTEIQYLTVQENDKVVFVNEWVITQVYKNDTNESILALTRND